MSLDLSRRVLLAAILLMMVMLGFFPPPASIVLMTAPIILSPLKPAISTACGSASSWPSSWSLARSTRPVGLDLFVIKTIAPDLPLRDAGWGVMPLWH